MVTGAHTAEETGRKKRFEHSTLLFSSLPSFPPSGGENSYEHLKVEKGFAFEHLVGLLLAYKFPSEEIVSQCVVKGATGRATIDFRVGKAFYEAKWGNARKRIERSVRKHCKLINGYSYTLIRLHNTVHLTLPARAREIPFFSFIRNIDVRTAYASGVVADALVTAAKERDTPFIALLGTYLALEFYAAKSVFEEKRQEKICDALQYAKRALQKEKKRAQKLLEQRVAQSVQCVMREQQLLTKS